MIIKAVNNSYIIKLIGTNIDIYNKKDLEEITKKIIVKITKNYKLKNYIHLEFYINKNYGTIIKLTDYNNPFVNKKEKTIKITIQTNATFLYQIDYFDIKNKHTTKNNIYYYKNKFYLEINSEISTKDYLNILELSEIIYEDTEYILDKGIKI